MYIVGVDGIGEFNACEILAHVNDTENITVLNSMKWNKEGKKNFLMKKENSTVADVAEALTEEQAEQAIKEYEKMGYHLTK